MIKEVPCAFCGASILGRLFVVCASCEVPMHHDCWAIALTCPAFACGSTETVDPALVIYRKTTALVPVEPAPPVPARPVAARLQCLDLRILETTRALRPYNMLFGGSLGGGTLLTMLGAKLASAALIASGVSVLALGTMLAAMAAATPARRLQLARDERDRLELELADSPAKSHMG